MSLESRQLRLLGVVLVAMCGLLTVLWFTVLRVNYVPAYQNIRQNDASAIVAELDSAGIPYRLANDGHDILVPEEQQSEARVAIAGSTIAIGGTVGFELFNDSDMGLTEFAQKINFQRAMQGEISRTIMMMEGVDFARVHLAIPERSIFRTSDESPTAAVTIEMLPGERLGPQRIAGIQQLVASSVPGLETYGVSILNQRGDLVSVNAQTSNNVPSGPASERAALEAFYAAKAHRAIEETLPGLRFEVELAARKDLESAEEGALNELDEVQRNSPPRNDLTFGVIVRTQQTLLAAQRDAITTALERALGLRVSSGDSLNFTTGALSPATSPYLAGIAEDPAPLAQPASENADGGWAQGSRSFFGSRWSYFLIALLVLVAIAVWPRRRLAEEDTKSFAELLKNAAQDREEATHG